MTGMHKDAADKNIAVGSYVCYAIRYGSTLKLKFGRVVELKVTERGKSKITAVTVDNSWGDDWKLQCDGKPQTLETLTTMMVVGLPQLPHGVAATLRAPWSIARKRAVKAEREYHAREAAYLRDLRKSEAAFDVETHSINPSDITYGG